MKKKLNIVIDALMCILLAAISGLGFLMKYVLIPGKERMVKYGRQVDLYYLGLDRHEWGVIHLILGLVMLGLLVLHIVLHWSMIKSFFRKLVYNKQLRKPVAILFSLLCVFLFVFPFLIKIEIQEVLPGEGHHSLHQSVHQELTEKQTAGNSVIEIFENRQHILRRMKQAYHDCSDHYDPDIRVQGSMTLMQVSNVYNIPVRSILVGLGIQTLISPNEQLGHLKKRYSFRMRKVENIIRLYRTKKENYI